MTGNQPGSSTFLICTYCNGQFGSERKLGVHIQMKHTNPDIKSENANLKDRKPVQFPSKLFPLGLSSGGVNCAPPPSEDSVSNIDRPSSVTLPSEFSGEQTICSENRRNKRATENSSPAFTRNRRRSNFRTPNYNERSPSPEPLPKICLLCNLWYRSHSAWKHHAINVHILSQHRVPRVEMNYIDVKPTAVNIDASKECSVIGKAKVTPPTSESEGKVPEHLKLTFCREKGSYVVKNSSCPEELSDLPSSCPNLHGENIEHSSSAQGSNPNGILGINSDSESGGSEKRGIPSIEVNPITDEESSEPGFEAGGVSQTPAQDPKGVAVVPKVPTSGTVVYLGSSASESDKALANSGNSHMVIIQNDILRIGADADEENIQRITAATAANTPQADAKKSNNVVQVDPREDQTVLKALLQKDNEIVNTNTPTYFKDMAAMISQGASPVVNDSEQFNEERSSCHGSSQCSETAQDSIPPQSERDSVIQIPEDNSESPKQVSNATNPLHIILPRGLEIQPISMSSTPVQGGEIKPSETESLEKNNEPSEVQQHDDADDFRCKVCNVLFTSDDELEAHFSQAHFRGIANSILEPPESPCVGIPETPAPPPAAYLSSPGGIFRKKSTEEGSNLETQTQGFSATHHPGLRAERRASDSFPQDFVNSYKRHANINADFNTRDGILQQNSFPMRNIRQTSPARVFNQYSSQRTQRDGVLVQPAINSLPSTRLQVPLGAAHPQSYHAPFLSRSAIPHHRAQYGSQTQQQSDRRVPSSVYPSALTNALGSGAQSNQHQLPLAQLHRPGQDGPRIVDVTSMVSGRAPQTQAISQRQNPQMNHLLAMQQQQQYQLLQQNNLRFRQQQQEHQHRQMLLQRHQILEQQLQSGLRMRMQSHSPVQNASHLQGKRSGSQENMGSIQKQARIDPPPYAAQDERSRLQLYAPARIEFQNSANDSVQAQSASRYENGALRIGNSITLSVCPAGDESHNPTQTSPTSSLLRNSIISRQGQRPSGDMNATNIASALAIRGVTVSPASPPTSTATSEASRVMDNGLPLNSYNPSSLNEANPALMEISSSAAVPVIQNRAAHGSGANNGPSSPHQFAVPQSPVVRIQSPSRISVADRPERPPTIDLTTDEVNSYVNSRTLERRPSVQIVPHSVAIQRAPPSRPILSCNECGVIFCSSESLEEHKKHRHRPPALAINGIPGRGEQNPSPPVKEPQPLRPANQGTASLPLVQVPTSTQRTLYIPLLDMSRMDPSKLKRLEEFGLCSMIPLQGNDRTLGQIGIPLILPTINLRDGLDQEQGSMPWDRLQPVGPVVTPSQLGNSQNQ